MSERPSRPDDPVCLFAVYFAATLFAIAAGITIAFPFVVRLILWYLLWADEVMR